PPRIAPVFDDLNPARAGGVYRRIDGDALIVTWCDVPEFDNVNNRVNVQLRLGTDGSIEFIYGATVQAAAAVVGVSPGETGVFNPVDISASAGATLAGGSGAVRGPFPTQAPPGFVALTPEVYQTP